MQKFLLSVIGTLSLVACVHQPTWSVVDGAEKVVAMQKDLEKPNLGIERVTILRLSMEGKRLEVSSISPTVIVAEPARGNRTVLNISDQQKLVLFTRDGKNIKGYRQEFPLSDLTPGKVINFPMAQDPGEVVEKTLTVERLILQ